jgi:hypothetical protein
MSVVFGLSICMARGNNLIGNENDLLGCFLGVVGGGEHSNNEVGL